VNGKIDVANDSFWDTPLKKSSNSVNIFLKKGITTPRPSIAFGPHGRINEYVRDASTVSGLRIFICPA
jgi:hypothetical protein